MKELDKLLGGIREHAYILFHEEDPRSLGRELVFRFIRYKLENDNLMGIFNISYSLPFLLEVMCKNGIDADSYLDSLNLAIVDTFGSFYGPRIRRRGVWYLPGSPSYELLSRKYAEVVRAHKELWAEKGMFSGRELWGVAVDVSEYIRIFGEANTLSYFEISAEVRRQHEAYRRYPAGTNIWVFSGDVDRVFSSLYRRVDYVFRTRSVLTEDGVTRYLYVLKAPGLSDIPVFEYRITKDDVKVKRT
ncbi:hypothetical protein [Thermococcus sp.]|uniref:hypothetical protein n=1 Tax=Thermococcus sp. TaxID=35749 RepID=UPI00262DEFA5|nr:hypothetical protein [Thermococcus sp.]